MNALDNLPRKVQPEAKEYLRKMAYAPTGRGAKVCEVLDRDWERMVTFYEFLKEHRRHIKTTNIIESPLATIMLRKCMARRYKRGSRF